MELKHENYIAKVYGDLQDGRVWVGIELYDVNFKFLKFTEKTWIEKEPTNISLTYQVNEDVNPSVTCYPEIK